MSIGSWNPDLEQSQTNITINNDDLLRFIDFSEDEQLDEVATLLSQDEQQRLAGLMSLTKEQWIAAADKLSDNQIIHLMRFFTVAEKLPGWEAEGKSPVIGLGKILKKRGTGINRDLVLWIKANSDNQYLPHGPLL
ncbi:MAG: hypothetical protein GY712_04095 [Oceanicoccus sp.]|uniref:hypothetical protein n=1 Tax=Oceanicoccus sp. TaxID=2691044 RepID=UPI002605D7E6|nr:hypothetical protein [Oceanicoccus sp.]MCP3907179.1 hypothetical protein [Oceanicoccus sp.]MDG1772256.1 hypothetical protein [Oceanicoccus sp.]